MKPALVIGAAKCVYRDLAKLEEIVGAPLEDVFTIFAANDGGVLWRGRLDFWATLHPDEMPERMERRAEAGGERGYIILGRMGPVDRVIPPDYAIDGMTSAGLAVGAARAMGHERIVLAGCPFSHQGYAVNHTHHGGGPWPYWRTYQEALPAVVRRHPWIKGTVRSMSGFTKEKLGGLPTKEWLDT